MSDERFVAVVDVLAANPTRSLNPLGAAILAAAALDICHNSRAFARRFDVAHSLVLRELSLLSEDEAVLDLVDRDDRTLRATYRLNSLGNEIAALGINASSTTPG